MKTAMISTLLLHILGYAAYCTAAPQSTTSVETFKLRVWNYIQSNPHYDGYAELYLEQVSFQVTPFNSGFDVYLDPANPGMIRESSNGYYGALIPTNTTGYYSFKFISDPTTPYALTRGFSFLPLGCGNCGGVYLDYRTSSDDLNPTTFAIVPNTDTSLAGNWSIYYDNYTQNALPAGSYAISLLQQT